MSENKDLEFLRLNGTITIQSKKKKEKKGGNPCSPDKLIINFSLVAIVEH